MMFSLVFLGVDMLGVRSGAALSAGRVAVGLGLLALLSLIKSGWPQRALVAAAYGTVMCILADTVGNPVLITRAVLWAPK